MNFIEMLFKLVAKFIDLPQADIDQMRIDAKSWVDQNKDHQVFGKIIEIQNLWFMRLLFCFVMLWLTRVIASWLTRDFGEDDEDEDEDDSNAELIKLLLHSKKKKEGFSAMSKFKL